VLVHQSELLRNNTVVVMGRAGVLLIDPGLSGAEMVCLADDLREMGQPVAAGFATHPDWDHVLWHADIGEVPRYGTARCAAFMRDVRSDAKWEARVAEGLPPEIADDVPLDLCGLITGLPAETALVPWDGPHVRVIEHPAHAPGHSALFVGERGVLVAGDMLCDLFVPMLDVEAAADPIGDYLVGLGELEAVADDVDVLVPGHGSVGGASQVRARIDLDRAYVHSLRDGRAPDGDRTATPGSARQLSPAGNGSATYTRRKCRASPEEADATGRPASDPLSAHSDARTKPPCSTASSPGLGSSESLLGCGRRVRGQLATPRFWRSVSPTCRSLLRRLHV
jgi:glyoxylase-like metal-dependent hydrolase (beta-lactamase superfamily II)